MDPTLLEIISVLNTNPKLLQKFCELIDFERTKHSINDDDRPCNKGDIYDQCDDCYSGDTQCDNEYEMREFFKAMGKAMPIHHDGEDENGEESE